MDLESVGAAATAGLIAKAIEKPTGIAGEAHAVCPDCGTETIGRFCHQCGNPTHVHRTLLHLFEELLHGVMHFDSRAWRTLPLLFFRPGKLTREWVLGRRTRYVSPLAMFLFTIFIIFMSLSYLPVRSAAGLAEAEAGADVAKRVADLGLAKRALEAAPPTARVAEQARLDAATAALEEAVEKARVETGAPAPGPGRTGDWRQDIRDAARSGQVAITTGNDKLDEMILKKLENPELTVYKLEQTFYKFSFLLVPISIPFVALLFLWKRGFTLYDHGVFVLYSLTFMAMLLMALGVAGRIGGPVESLAAWALLAAPAHMFFQLKGAYGLGVLSALWRTFFLVLFAAMALVCFVLAILGLGMI